MIFTPTPLAGAFVIEPEPVSDTRGLFARTWCERELQAHGLESRLAQCSTSFNKRKETLRGMHYQLPPFAETKIVGIGQAFQRATDWHLRRPDLSAWK